MAMTTLRNFLILYWTFQTVLAVTTVTVDLCQNGYYYVSGACHPCSLCSNEEVLLPCTSTSNTICLYCHNRIKSDNINNQSSAGAELSKTRHCQNCTNCTRFHREERMACSPTQDSRCGGCLDGYFLGVTVEGIIECLACSWCPPRDKSIIRWRECQDAGLDQDMWCSPGHGSPPDSYIKNTAIFTMDSFQEETGNLVVDSSDSMIVAAIATLIGIFLTVCICTLCFCTCVSVKQDIHVSLPSPYLGADD